MIRFTTNDGKAVVTAETRGYGVYLDNDSLIDLATGSASRQDRFVDALQARGTLMFSWTHAIELAGPQGRSAYAVRAFLNRIGPHWIPLELDPFEVVRRERAWPIDEAPVSAEFMKVHCQRRMDDERKSNAVINLTQERFFQLGDVVDWVREQRDRVRALAEKLDTEA